MTNHDQKSIIQEQMQANERIIKAARSAQSGRFVSRVSINKRMKQFVTHETMGVKSNPRPPKSK